MRLSREERRKIRMAKKPEDLDLARRPPEELAGEHVRAAAMASLILGDSPKQVAEMYGLKLATVKRMKESFDITNPINRRDRLSETLVAFLENEVKNLISIGIVTSDEDWIKWQNASDLSQYIRVKNEMMSQLLQSYGRAAAHSQELKIEAADE